VEWKQKTQPKMHPSRYPPKRSSSLMTKHNENNCLPYEHYFSVDFTLKCGVCPKTFAVTRGDCVIMNCCKTLVHESCADCCIKMINVCPRCFEKPQYIKYVSANDEQQLFDFLKNDINNLSCDEKGKTSVQNK
jgi:hypothetical protein